MSTLVVNPSSSVGSSRRGLLLLIAVCVVGLVLAARGIWDEGAVSLDGDMPRYLMNGVFLRDVIQDLPFEAPLQYAQRYYARYPALSLGHHPILPAVLEVPFYFAFGVSVFSARLSALTALAVAIVFWFRLIRELYDTTTALFASLLLITTPGFISLFRVVLSEPYTLCLIILSVYFMKRYCATERPFDAFAFACCAVLSAYAKQLAAFMFPLYAFQFYAAFGFRRLWRPSTLGVIAAMTVCLLPLVPLTLKYSPFNVAIVADSPVETRITNHNFLRYLSRLWSGPLRPSAPLLAMAGLSTIGAIINHDRRAVLFVVWIVSVYLALVGLGVGNDRFACYWLPAFCALGAAVLGFGSTKAWRTAATLCLAATVGYQLWLGGASSNATGNKLVYMTGATGYEEAARYVAENRRGATVLYSAAVDSGYFVFFVRKYDANREMVVLRADKVLTTSRMRRLNLETRISRPEEIAAILGRFGVGYVIIEDRPYPDGPLRWLQQAVETTDFELRKQIRIESNDRRLSRGTLSIYAVNRLTPPEPEAVIQINLPIVNDQIHVRLADLLTPASAVVQQ